MTKSKPKHRMSPYATGTIARCIECGNYWPCPPAQAAGASYLPRQELRDLVVTVAGEPSAWDIARMSRHDYLAWCAQHLARARRAALVKARQQQARDNARRMAS